MKRAILAIAMLGVSAPAMAQQQAGLDQATLQKLQQVLGNQTINMRQQRANIRTNCDENIFMQCRTGYQCTSAGANGATSQTVVRGRANGLCAVSITNSDGSRGECNYTDATMEQMLRLYQSDTVTVAQAIESGSRMMQECKFVDAQGKPFAMPSINGVNGVAQ